MNDDCNEDGDENVKIRENYSKRNWKHRRISSSSSEEENDLGDFRCSDTDQPGFDSSEQDSETRKNWKRIKQIRSSSSEESDEEVCSSSSGVAGLVVAEEKSSGELSNAEDQAENSTGGRKALTVVLELTAKLDINDVVGVAKLRKTVCVLRESPTTLTLYEDGLPPIYKTELSLTEIKHPTEIVACNKTKFLYIGDRHTSCLWRVKLRSSGELSELEKWMDGVENIWTFSIDARGRIVIPRNRPADSVCIYDSDAHLLHQIFLPESISRPGHAVLKRNGTVLLTHSHMVGLAELDSNGALVRRFASSRISEIYSNKFVFKHFVILGDDRVLVADGATNAMILLDRKLEKVTVVSSERPGIVEPERICYDGVKRTLIVVGVGRVEFFKLVER